MEILPPQDIQNFTSEIFLIKEIVEAMREQSDIGLHSALFFLYDKINKVSFKTGKN